MPNFWIQYTDNTNNKFIYIEEILQNRIRSCNNYVISLVWLANYLFIYFVSLVTCASPIIYSLSLTDK